MGWGKWLLGAVITVLAVTAAVPARAINIRIDAGATIRVEPGNIVVISPVTLMSPDVPGYPPGTYTVRFEWNPFGNALVPISATAVGGGTTGRHVGQEFNGIVIESESLTPGFSANSCFLRLGVRNRTGQLKSIGLTFNAFNAAGAGIGFTIASGLVSANGTAILEGIWTSSSAFIPCSQIARYDIDLSSSYSAP